MLVPIILSGGTGTRLWPVSRESHPKPFIKLPDGQSLLQKTFLRASSLPNVTEMIVVTNNEYFLKTKSEYDSMAENGDHFPALSFLLEPCLRNTAPAIVMAVLKIAALYGEETLLLVLPADHLIDNFFAFKQDCEKAILLAKQDKIVVFGIKPASPQTGYGYIECGQALMTDAYRVLRFIEKPANPIAQRFYHAGHFLWNVGMFCFNVKTILKEFNKHAPAILRDTEKCWEKSKYNRYGSSALNLDVDSFAHIENISIDYALMEKSDTMMVVNCHFDWQDIGSWESYKKLHQSDQNGNTVLGETIIIDSYDNFVHNENRLVALIGVENLYIVDTPDALLISKSDRSQEVKKVVQLLKENAHESYLTHKTVLRPWGFFTVLEETDFFKIKRIVVNPGASLSLQSHQHRNEHWIIVEGIASIINGDQEVILEKNQSISIPANQLHKLTNAGLSDLIIVEVQTGSYLGEDDIVRYEDAYGRVFNGNIT